MKTALHKKRKKSLFAIFWGLIGPGMLAALADNDAGGVISYTVTGAKFGIGLFIPLTLCLVFITYTVQEMAMRLGVVTSKGYTYLMKEKYGRFWMGYQLVSLVIENMITLITEFIGMSAGLTIIGCPLWCSVLISLLLVLSIAFFSGYTTKERIAIIIAFFNIAFIAVACFTKPDFSAIAKAFVTWAVPNEEHNSVCWYVVALIGNAIAPWMIFYQNNAYADKGVKADEIHNGRLDTIIGCVCQVVVAVFLIIIGASLYGKLPNIEQAGPIQMIHALNQNYGFIAALLFGMGLFNSGLLASITVSLSSSWSIAAAFGWSKSLNDKVWEAPKFYASYFLSVCIAAGAVLIPNLPLNHLAILTQILSGILMTPILLFLTLLTSNQEIMGEYKNSRIEKICAWISVAILSAISLASICKIL